MKKMPEDVVILHVYHKWQSYHVWLLMYDGWLLRYRTWLTELFIILYPILTLYPPNNPKIQNFEKRKKKKKTAEDIFILHKCTINENHIMYGASYAAWKTEFFVILDHILPFYPTNNLLFGKKRKNHLELLSFHTCVPWMTIIWCKVPKIWSTSDKIFCHCGPSFALLPH